MPNLELKGYSIDDVTKGLGAMAVAAYVLGYLVLSYNLSAFGLNPVSPFRPRVLETGFCALIFFAVPVLIGAAAASIPRRGTPPAFIFSLRVLCLPILCGSVTNVPGFIDQLPKSISQNAIFGTHRVVIRLVLIATIVITAGLLWLIAQAAKWIWCNYHQKKLLSILILSLISSAAIILGINATNTSAQVRSFFWLLAISLVTCALIGSDGEESEEKRINQEISELEDVGDKLDRLLEEITGEPRSKVVNLSLDQGMDELSQAKALKVRVTTLLNEIRSETSPRRLRRFIYIYGPLILFGYSVFVIAAYSIWVFPFIPLKLGGGEIVGVTIYETEASQSPHVIHGGMLDQSDQGFFILPSGRDKGLFIPKERVDSIYFANDSSDLIGGKVSAGGLP